MKTNYLFLAFSFAAMTLASCSDEVNDVLDAQDEQTTSQDSVFTYDMIFDSEITPYDGTTRASMASDWEDGDVVYLRFGGVNNNHRGQAEYISSTQKWHVTCNWALLDATNAKCEVWFSKGVNPTETSNYIGYDYVTEAYGTSSGLYTFSNNSIYINATMEPHGRRLRFKGTVGTEIQTNYEHWWQMDKGFDGYMARTTSIILTVGSNGYTNYFIISPSGTSIRIRNNSTGESFTRYFDENTLKNRESGYFTIPTSSDLHGWTQVYD